MGVQYATPALGAADWSGFVSQQGFTDRGHLALSLTDMALSSVSQIGGGSIAEIAGSIFGFPSVETINVSSWAAIATAADVYIKLVASGTSVIGEYTTDVPVWRDDYQGFYGSAASIERYIGGCYKAGTSSYENKYLYLKGDQLNYLLQTGTTRPILKKVLEIGEWNMDVTGQVNVAHGLTWPLRSASVWIRSDDDTQGILLNYSQSGSATAGYWIMNEANMNLIRTVGGTFDNINFDGTASTVPNRGWVSIEYQA